MLDERLEQEAVALEERAGAAAKTKRGGRVTGLHVQDIADPGTAGQDPGAGAVFLFGGDADQRLGIDQGRERRGLDAGPQNQVAGAFVARERFL